MGYEGKPCPETAKRRAIYKRAVSSPQLSSDSFQTQCLQVCRAHLPPKSAGNSPIHYCALCNISVSCKVPEGHNLLLSCGFMVTIFRETKTLSQPKGEFSHHIAAPQQYPLSSSFLVQQI